MAQQALIVGAGIGGLTTALCLQRIGWNVVLLEQAQALSDIGAGIQISPNGTRILNALGVLDRLTKTHFQPERIEMRLGKSGRQVFSIPLREAAMQRWGAPYLHLHRADLINALKETLEDGAAHRLHTAHRVTGYRQDEQKIEAILADGTSLTGDALIAADGIHSTIREQMLGPQTPRFTGNVAWRATVPMDLLGDLAPPPTACIWVGPQRHAVTYRLRGGKLANFVGVVEQQDWQKESWTEAGDRADVLADFEGWHPTITRIISQAQQHYRWALFDREPLSRWTDGRAALLGDACHPMLPFLAQGAVMAIEDAWVLAQQLEQVTEPSRALSDYAHSRQPRSAKVQRGSRANMKTFHHRSPIAYLPFWLVGKLRPQYFHARQDWLYGENLLEQNASQ